MLQARHVGLQAELSVKLNSEYIPSVNKFYNDKNTHVQVNVGDLASWARKDKRNNSLPDSLQQIVEHAYATLHPKKVEETKPNAPDPVNEKFEPETSIFMDPDAPFIDDYKQDEMPSRLFPEGAPGDLALVGPDLEAIVDVTECMTEYEKLFVHLSREPWNSGERSSKEQKEDDRSVAVELFNTELNKLPETPESIKHIVSLVTVAKPYINRHDHYYVEKIRETFSEKKDTATWELAFINAQSKALKILENAVKNLGENARPFLLEWQHQFLFTNKIKPAESDSWFGGLSIWGHAPKPAEEVITIELLLGKLDAEAEAEADKQLLLSTIRLLG